MFNAISPIDGRYRTLTDALRPYVSESALMRYRVMVEIEYFIALGDEPGVPELAKVKVNHQKTLRKFYEDFSDTDAARIKTIERTTNHDVKAVEYFLQEKFVRWGLKKYVNFIHFGLTSYDVNNTAYALMLRDALSKAVMPALADVLKLLRTLAKKYAREPMLARTHGQPASPTTMGKELAVFAHRLAGQMESLKHPLLYGKLSGATGNWNAVALAYPKVNWINFSRRFMQRLGLAFNPLTTQIQPYDDFATVFDALKRCNTILVDMSRDLWTYIGMGYFTQALKEGEVGSSAMPHKVNPIDFENAEGNLGVANALLEHLSAKLPISRLQRDLTDSTVLRTLGVPLAHSVIAYRNALKGLSKVRLNRDALRADLERHPEVIAEGIQTVLRKAGYEKPYEALKSLTRGKHITIDDIYDFVNTLPISESLKQQLMQISPDTYTGLASKLVQYM